MGKFWVVPLLLSVSDIYLCGCAGRRTIEGARRNASIPLAKFVIPELES